MVREWDTNKFGLVFFKNLNVMPLCFLDVCGKQECIPAGCVPSAAVAVSWGGGLSAPGGVYPSMH